MRRKSTRAAGWATDVIEYHSGMEGRPRILMLAPDTGFLSRRIIQEASTLARLGASVDVFPTVEPLPDPQFTVPGVRLMDRAVSSVPSGRVESRGRSLKALLRRRARPLHRFIDALQYTVTDRAGQIADSNIEQILRAGPYDVVFAHDIPVLPLGIRLKEAWGATLITDLHEIFPEQKDVLGSVQAQRYWRRVEAAGLPACDGILCVNEAVESYVTERYRVTSNLRVLHNAVPYVAGRTYGVPRIHEIYGLPPATRIAVFGGSLRLHGNLETMVLGFAAAQLEGWVLALIGDGPLRPTLEHMVAKHGLEKTVYLGYRAPQDELVGVLASADFGIIPFLSYSQNLAISTPAKLYEYIQARLPILTTALPLIARVVEENADGGYFDAADTASAADGFRRFVETTLPGITAERLEQAARRVSWQHEEATLTAVVDGATGGAFGLSRRLEAERSGLSPSGDPG